MEKKKFQDGVHNLSNDDYHSSFGLSRSALMEFKKTPHHYHYKYLNVDYVAPEPTPAMIFGELVHTLILESNKFEERFVIKPNLDRRTKEGKSFYEFFLQTLNGRTPISNEDYEKAMQMSCAFDLTDNAYELIHDTFIEKSIYFTHESTGIQCKVRPDAWANGVVIDLKTSADASFRGFQTSAFKYGYFLQAGMIHEALKSLNLKMNNFVFIAIEKELPYATAIYTLDEEALQFGIQQFNDLMTEYAKCMKTDNWPSYGIKNLTLPKYAKYDDINEVEE